LFSGRGQNYHEKTLLANSLVGKVDFCLTAMCLTCAEDSILLPIFMMRKPLKQIAMFLSILLMMICCMKIYDDINLAVAHRCNSGLPCFAHTIQLVVHDGFTKLTTGRGHTTAKFLKISSLVHQNASFRQYLRTNLALEKSVPAVNATRWNSQHAQLKCTANLDHVKLTTLFREQSYGSLVPTGREHAVG